jgi:hypothetical protein
MTSWWAILLVYLVAAMVAPIATVGAFWVALRLDLHPAIGLPRSKGNHVTDYPTSKRLWALTIGIVGLQF